MSLAKKILDEANEDITTTNLYRVVIDNVENIIEGLNVLREEFNGAHSDTTVEDINNYNMLIQSLSTVCNELDKEGFTYFPQPTAFKNSQLYDVFGNFISFYEEYIDGFAPEDIEILNTNSKDLMSIISKLNK